VPPETAQDWLDLVLDPGWVEHDAGLAAGDPIGFPGYADRDAKQESVVSAEGAVEGLPVVAVSFEFRVFGGTMGVAAGEKVARAFERAARRRAAVVALVASGGARVQEGMAALAQMAKTLLARRALQVAGLPFLAYLRHPTTGGTYASFAALADVLWAEPGATVAFAGPRVAGPGEGEEDGDARTAEAALEAGLVDDVVPPEGLRRAVEAFLAVTLRPDAPPPPPPPPRAARPPAGSWELLLRARDPARPGARRILGALAEQVVELSGDRAGTDDPGVLACLARIGGRRVGLVALDRARPTPPGYRKAYRLLRLAAALDLPLVTLLDTPGADAAAGSERGGIARTIGTTFRTVLEHPAPTVAVVTGEGGSGGALALACCDRLLVAEGACFEVIAPEGAAAILRRDDLPQLAADLRLGPADLLALGLADGVLPEPSGGAGADPEAFSRTVGDAVAAELAALAATPREDRLAARRTRWREAGKAHLL
jgi:acetyl-CoA carboxylase alpha subunit/acetyl-CoA carboxylase beta subunit